MAENIESNGCSQRDSAEHEGYAKVHRSFNRIWKERDSAQPKLLEAILCKDNLNRAYKRVKANKGAPGIDGMTIKEALPYLKEHQHELTDRILRGKYTPFPVRRVEIPKPDGGVRKLGIPTVTDRTLQQAITQQLVPIYEPLFAEGSYGYRPNRSAKDAILKVKEYAEQGYTFAVVLDLSKYFDTLNHEILINLLRKKVNDGYVYVVDMDLEKFFDTVCQSKLIEVLSRSIKDGRVVSLIHKYLNAGVLVNGMFERTETGMPQGGPLSPLLSNIMLNELDKELERRGHRFVRYADDCMIFCKSGKSAERTLENIIPFIEGKLFLRVNQKKTGVAHISKVKYLGYSFYRYKGKCRFRVHPKSVAKMKNKIRELTDRNNGMSNLKREEKYQQYVRGWVNYFKLADMKQLLKTTDEWARRRIRAVYWKQWKKIKTKYRILKALGLEHWKAKEFACSRKGYWRMAQVLNSIITNKIIAKLGYMSMLDYYLVVYEN